MDHYIHQNQYNGHYSNPVHPIKQIFQNLDVVELLGNDSLTSFLQESDPNADRKRAAENVSPDAMRPSLRIMPNTKAMLSAVSLPFGVIIQPFDNTNLSKIGERIERCRNCKAYLNPYCIFITPRMYRCPLCLRNNEVSESTRISLNENMNGLTSLNNNSVDYTATDEYHTNPPSPPTFLFALDISGGAISSGYLQICSELLIRNLKILSFNPRTMVGFVFFGSTVSVLTLNENTDKLMLMVLSDLSELVKLPNILVNCNQHYDRLLGAIGEFPDWFSGQNDPHSSLGYVMGFSQLILKSFGGRITVFVNQLADLEPGKIPLLSNECTSLPTRADVNPRTIYYKSLAIAMWEIRVTVDLFVIGGQSVDLPSIGQLSRLTGGTLYYFPKFHSVHNPLQCDIFRRDLEEYLSSDYGYDAMVRVRLSRGMEIRSVMGNLFMNGTDFFRLGYFRPDFSFSVMLDLSEDYCNDSAFVQAVLFYHNSHSELHITVHTLKIQVTDSIPRVLLSADQHATALIIARLLSAKALNEGAEESLKLLRNSISDLLKICRDPKNFGGCLSLRVPVCKTISLLPFLVFSLLTHTTFTSGELPLDERYAAFTRVLSLKANLMIPEISPNLYDITEIGLSCYGDSEGRYFTTIGPLLTLAFCNLTKTGVFMLDMGSVCYVLPRDQTPGDVLFDFFGVCEYSQVPEGQFVPGKFRNWNSYGLALAVRQLSVLRRRHILVFVFKDNDLGHTEFIQRLKCDRTRSCQSYVEYINGLSG